MNKLLPWGSLVVLLGALVAPLSALAAPFTTPMNLECSNPQDTEVALLDIIGHSGDYKVYYSHWDRSGGFHNGSLGAFKVTHQGTHRVILSRESSVNGREDTLIYDTKRNTLILYDFISARSGDWDVAKGLRCKVAHP